MISFIHEWDKVLFFVGNLICRVGQLSRWVLIIALLRVFPTDRINIISRHEAFQTATDYSLVVQSFHTVEIALT